MNQISIKKKYLFFKETDPYRYYLLYRGQVLVFAGYCIVTIETFLAITLGLTQITYRQTLIISSSVLLVTLFLFIFIAVKKKLLVWQEWMVFGVDMIFYLAFFCLWVYFLGNLRILGLFSSLVAITIVLSYTTFFQSLFMSMTTIVCYFAVTYYALIKGGQYGSIEREAFLTFSILPAYLLIAVTAKMMEKQRRSSQRAKRELEHANEDLHELNRKLLYEQSLTEIEMELAHDIQSSIFPAKAPVVRDWDIAFISKPKSGVSGDFYDFYTEGDTLEGLSLFDVSGHGVAPALITILTKPVLFRNFKKRSGERVSAIIDATNQDLMDQLEDVNIYITGVLLRMRENMIEYVNAGHPDLLHFKSSTGKVRVVSDPEGRFKGKPLGISSGKSQYSSVRFAISPGDSILMFTDGIIECRNSDGISFGRGRIEQAFSETAGMNAMSALEYLMASIYDFSGCEAASDDMTVIVARRL